jgi:hypothetical protein
MGRRAEQQAQRAQQITAMTAMFFVGQEPGVVGSVLAELMATFLSNHVVPNNAAKEADLRAKLLAQWCETVWSMVAVNDGMSETKQ